MIFSSHRVAAVAAAMCLVLPPVLTCAAAASVAEAREAQGVPGIKVRSASARVIADGVSKGEVNLVADRRGKAEVQRLEGSRWTAIQRGRVRAKYTNLFFEVEPGQNRLRVVMPEVRRYPEAVSLTFVVQGIVPPESTPAESQEVRERTLEAYNQARAKRGLAPLVMADELNDVAQAVAVAASSRDKHQTEYFDEGYSQFPQGYRAIGYCGGTGQAQLQSNGQTDDPDWTVGLDGKIFDEEITHVAIGVYRARGDSLWVGVSYLVVEESDDQPSEPGVG